MPKKTTGPAAPPASAEYVPSIEEVGLPKPVLIKVSRLIEQHAEWGRMKKEATSEQKKVIGPIKEILGEYQIGRMYCGDSRVTYFNVPRKSLSPEKLLEQGVSPQVIAASYVTKNTPTLKISPRDEPEKDEEWE